jgi:hypothetical protein
MIPTEWINSFKDDAYKFSFSTDISSKFNYLFYDYINAEDYTYIPYAIDPYVTYVKK